jgi:hypothetical protein
MQGDSTNASILSTQEFDPFVKAIEIAKLFLDEAKSKKVNGKPLSTKEVEDLFCSNPYQLFA